MEVEWDARKAEANARKHGITFEEAATALLDPFALTAVDEGLYDEVREVTVGLSALGKLLLVVHVDRGAERIRIVSARKATTRERRDYEEGI